MAGRSTETEEPFEDEAEPNATLAPPTGERAYGERMAGAASRLLT
jgi:hypothetical protein